ncbi:hypothetical protein [Sedimentibacter saalensis]|nr:hypothetical protein [Sedimentibacter saalensis]
MDMIKFCKWHDNKLLIVCEEFFNWGNYVKLELDENTFEITIK